MGRLVIGLIILLTLGAAIALWLGVAEVSQPEISQQRPNLSSDEHSAPSTVADTTGRPLESDARTGSPTFSFPFPEQYRSLIGVTGQQNRFADLFAQFESEIRDEEWAFDMEAHLSNYASWAGPDRGVVFEFIRCQSEFCVFAGYVLAGRDNQSAKILSDLVTQPWWKGGDSSISRGGKIGENDAFVILLPR